MLKLATRCTVTMLIAASAANGQTTWYVDANNCPGPGSGTEEDPFCKIQKGIDAAAIANGDDVLVAGGSYNELINFDGKAITVHSINGAAVTTIDGTGLNDSVVTCTSGEGTDTVLDGLTITGGVATNGGGMHNVGSSPTVTNCSFSGNLANINGGGMSNLDSSPTVTNCSFSGNLANINGGGMYNLGSSPTLINCSFNGNTCLYGDSFGARGGGVDFVGGSPTVTNCMFTGNSAADTGYGGGMASDSSVTTVTNCTFSENVATYGGGMYVSGSGGGPMVTECTFSQNVATYGGGGLAGGNDVTVTNCVFRGNAAEVGGGMLTPTASSPTVTNCIFSGNMANQDGGGMENSEYSEPTVSNCTFSGNTAGVGGGMHNNSDSSTTVTNCIFWGDSPSEFHPQSARGLSVSFCNVQGGVSETVDGGGNIDTDPLFVDPDGEDDLPGTEDDDLRFLPGSPCIDAARNGDVPADVADLDGDGDTAEPTPFDLDGNPRFHDDPTAPDCPQDPGECGTAPIVDMGPYEFLGTKVPDCEGDANGDGLVDPLDSGFVLARFGCQVGAGDPDCDSADVNGDEQVNPLDVGYVLARFGMCE